MSRRTTPRRNRKDRPSTFFIVAFAIGLTAFIIIWTVMINRPAKPLPQTDGKSHTELRMPADALPG